MKRKIVNWKWEDRDAQKSFSEWVGFPDKKETAEEIDKIEKLLKLSPPLKILDAGCGPGRHSIELAGRGYKVTAIDIAEGYLKEGKKKALEKGLSIDFKLLKCSELEEENLYDFILAYDHTIGFMEEKELDLHFSKIYKALKKTGKFLLSIAGPKIIPGETLEKSNSWMEKDKKFILEEKYIKDGYRYENCIVIDTDKNEITEFCEKQKAFSFKDIMNILKKAGFSKMNTFKDLDCSPATDKEFKVFVCYKEER